MARANCGLFLLVMLNMLCESHIYCTGYYNHMLYKHKQLNTNPWIKHKISKVPIYKHPHKMLQFTSHQTFFPPKSGYYFKAPPMLAPKSAVTSFSPFPVMGGFGSHGWNSPYKIAKNRPKVNKNKDFYKKRNPKYLWLDFPDAKTTDSFLAMKTTGFPNNDQDFLPGINDGSVTRLDNPGGGVGEIYTPDQGDLHGNPSDVSVVSLTPNTPFENTDGFGPHSGSDSLNGFPKTDPSAHDIFKIRDPHMQGDGNLPNDVITYNGNLPQDVVSLDGIIPDSISSVPIQLDKIHTDGLLATGISADGGKIHNIGVSKINGNSPGTLNGNLPGIGNGNLVVSAPGDPAYLVDALVGSGSGLVNTVVPVLADVAVSNIVDGSFEHGHLPSTLEMDGRFSQFGNIGTQMDGTMSLDFQGSDNLSNGIDIGMESSDSSGSVSLGDDGSTGSEQSDIIVTLADPSRVRKVHQPLAKPLSLMLTIEPFGPGPYGTCRAPAKVICGARFGWEHVVGMASWCKENCVVYMYTSYCDDDRCQCECE